MEELFYGAIVGLISTVIEPGGIRRPRWWAAMITINALVLALRHGY